MRAGSLVAALLGAHSSLYLMPAMDTRWWGRGPTRPADDRREATPEKTFRSVARAHEP